MFIWPVHLFNPSEIGVPRIIEAVISGGTSLSGEEDVIATDGGGRWEVSFGGIRLNTPAKIKAWEAWEGYLARGRTDVIVPLLTLGHANRSNFGRAPAPVSKLVANDPVFPSLLRYSSPPIVARLAASAGLRATSLAIIIERGSPLVGGEKFSIGFRSYRIIRPLGAGLFQIEPPLREAAEIGASVVFDLPLLKCRSAPGESWSPTLTFGRAGDASIRFLENAS